MKKLRGVFVPDYETKFGDSDQPYQFEKYQAAKKLCREFRHAVDVGAHVGSWTLQMCADFARVTAFEPNSEMWQYFHLNVPNEPSIELWRMALGARQGQVALTAKTGTSLKTHVSPKGMGSVPMMPLDHFMLNPVDLLKIDTEGYELFVVQGGVQTIQHERPVIIVEQKKGVATARYGLPDTAAVELLIGWDYKVHAEMNGDYIMVPK